MRAWHSAALAAGLWIGALGSAHAQVLWQIGRPDGSYADMAIAGRFAEYAARFPRDVTYRVGQSSPERDWPYIQPGPADAWAGSRQHIFRILFPLAAVPAGACRLRIDLINTHPSVPPLLELTVNGQAVYRYQTPAGGDEGALTDPRLGRRSTVSAAFPSQRLRAGNNEIAITTRRGSWIIYDAVSLETGRSVPTAPAVAGLQALCTPLFKRVAGELRQAIAVSFDNPGIEGNVEASMQGAPAGPQSFAVLPGANLLHLLVPPFRAAGRARVIVRAGGKETAVEVDVRPERQWRLYVAPESHTDIGYTHLQPGTFAQHNTNTTMALKAAASDRAFRWDMEVAWQERAFASGLADPMTAPLARRRDPKQMAALYAALKDGRIGMQSIYLNMLTGLCTGEEMVRVVAWAQQQGIDHNFIVPWAQITDVPTCVGTLPMFLRQAGVRYFAEGINQSRGPVFRHPSRPPHQAPFWWEGLDGSRVLAVFADGYGQGAGLGLETSIDEFARRLPGWLHGFDRPDYAPDAVLAYGMVSDNQLMDPRYAAIAEEWNRRWEFPKVVLCRPDAFFRYVEQRYGPRLPVLRGDMGTFWEDGAASSAHETALTRWAKARLDSVERLSALAALSGAPGADAGGLHTGWENAILYDEHTWGAYNSTSEPTNPFVRSQWEWKANRARSAASLADRMLASSATYFAGKVAGSRSPGRARSRSAGAAYVVWNEHSWARDILASVPAPKAPGRFVVQEAGGGSLPTQLSSGMLLFLARQVPAFGWRAYRVVRSSSSTPQAPLLTAGGDTWSWSTPRFDLRFSPATGAVVELRDRVDGHEWVRAGAGYGLNQYVFAEGGGNSRLIEPQYAEPKLTLHTHGRARIELVENGPARAVLHLRREGQGVAPVDTWAVVDASGRLDFVNVVHMATARDKEAGYFAFPFSLGQGPATRGYVELPYGVLQVGKEQMPGACRDWYCTGSFAALTDGSWTASVISPQAPLVTYNDIWRGQWRPVLEPLNGTLFSYALNNYWYTNYRAAQPGDILLSYSLDLTRGSFDAGHATRTGWSQVSDMADPRRASQSAPWDASRPAEPVAGIRAPGGSALRVMGGTALVGGMRARGDRLQVRLYNPSAGLTTCTLGWQTAPMRAARLVDLAGRPLGSVPLKSAGRAVSVQVPARGLATVELTSGSGGRR